MFQRGREVKKTDATFIAKEEADKKDHAMCEMLRSGKKLDTEDVRMEQKAGGRQGFHNISAHSSPYRG